jgi:hypothetical protein
MEWPDKEIKAPFRICIERTRTDYIRMIGDAKAPLFQRGFFSEGRLAGNRQLNTILSQHCQFLFSISQRNNCNRSPKE